MMLWLLLVSLGIFGHRAQGTERPVVGVLAQELPYGLNQIYPNESSYIPAAYIKAVEASGARVAPVFINQSYEYYQSMMSSLNGMVLPGGDVDLTAPNGFAAAGRIILGLAMKMQDAGVQFPVLGVCQGYELLMYLFTNTSDPHDILQDCDAENIALPLVFKPDAHQSQLYRHVSSDIMEILATLPVTSNHHKECVTEAKLKARRLDKTWRVLSTNQDVHGLEFVSSSEHFQRPLVGVQFHPEKNMFEWNPHQANPHSRKAILSARLFYDWLVMESRANDQHFPTPAEEESSLVYNFSPSYTGGHGGYDEQVYFFR